MADGPWQDYATPAAPAGPWQDYAAAQPAQQPAPEPQPEVPPSFLHRLATGLAIGGAADASPEELRQKGYEDFDLPANTAQAFKNGVKNFVEAKTGIQRGAGLLEAAASPLTALFQAIGGAGEKASGGLLTNESVQDALMLSDGALGNFSRMRGGAEQVIGSLPKDADFQTAAKVLDSAAAEQNTRDLWQERGIHPGEAVHDAQNDAFLKQDIAPPSFVAFHGSPHDFDAFDISRIGTGEGAQSYGHGLYFAENPAVSESYRTAGQDFSYGGAATSGPEFNAAGALEAKSGDATAAVKLLKQQAHFAEEGTEQEDYLKAAKMLEEGWRTPSKPQGKMYQVNINADPEHFLDWDEPINGQSQYVRDAMAPVLREFGLDQENMDHLAGTHILNRMSEKLANGASSSPIVSERLRNAGIPGIKYLDQGSRDTKEGTRNFVVFSHNDIEITHKNGVRLTPTEMPNVQGTPVPDGTPRSELAKTGEAHIDKILESPVTQRVIDKPVIDREHTVPYTAGGSVPLEDPTVFIDHRFPRSFTVDGVTFDPADPFVVHENVEQHTMEMLIKGGMDAPTAYKVAHFEFAEKAEGAWYAAHGIDQAKAEAAYAPYMAEIQKDSIEPGMVEGRPFKSAIQVAGKTYASDSHLEAMDLAGKEHGLDATGISERADLKYGWEQNGQFFNDKDYTSPWTPKRGVPPNLYKRPYPHDNPSAAQHEPIAEPKPTAAEIKQAKAEAAYAPYMAEIQHDNDSLAGEVSKWASGMKGGADVTALPEAVRRLGSPIERDTTFYRGEWPGRPNLSNENGTISVSDRLGGQSFAMSRNDSQLENIGAGEGGELPLSEIRVRKGTTVLDASKYAGENAGELERMLPPGKFTKIGERLEPFSFGTEGQTGHYRITTYDFEPSISGGVPPNLYKRPYPHDNPSAAQHEPIAEPKPTAAEIKQAKAILDSQEAGGALKAMGADVTRDMPSLAQQPPRPAGSLMTAAKAAADKLFDMGRDAQMLVAPMAARGPNEGRAIAKDFANAMRRNRWEWDRYDSDIAKRFTPERRKRMWDAADEESVLRQEGQASEHMGLATLEPDERAAVEDLQARAQLAWARARDMGMVDGEGLPAYTPRMVINAASAVSGDKAIPLNGLGANLRTRTAQMMRRKYMTAEETEAAAKARLGDDATIARDIRALPLATARLEDAIAGRTLIDNIKDIGRRTGAETVADGWRPDSSWFTLDHPAFRTFKPRLEEVDGVMRAAKDADGNTIFDQVPLYVRGDLEGMLRAVLNVRKGAQSYSGALYGGLMALKGKTMGLIMNSPLIHNAVEWGRALPAMPGKVASFKVYFEGNRAKNDIATMKEAIDGGLVPIGKRFFNQDITSIMEEPNLTPGRSWTSQVLGFVPGLFDEGAGTAVKAAIDKAGDFWHNTMLWDRVADLQMGLYTNFRDDLLAKGVDRQTAARAAAHWANRYAGALPKEAMSDAATKISNMLLFSRTFTMGNLGVLKDMLTGLPKDVLAQIERDGGFRPGSISTAGDIPQVGDFTKGMAKRKAMAVVALDMALFYVGNSVLQSALNVMMGDNTIDQEMHGYATRLHDALQKRAEHPLSLLQPFDFIQSLSSTAENEPGLEGRIKVGHAADGTAIYVRNPAGKIGEEFTSYMTGPLDMMRRKQGTIARPAFQIYANDAGFGRKIYDPDADTPGKYLRNMGNIAAHIAGSQLPEGQIGAFSDLVKGEGDPNINAAQAFGPLAGLTFRKGAPGGEAVGELYNARTEHNYAVDAELPDIRRQVQRGDEQGARERMTQLGIPRGLQNFYVRTSQNPATRLTPRTLRDFYNYATPEQKARMENAR